MFKLLSALLLLGSFQASSAAGRRGKTADAPTSSPTSSPTFSVQTCVATPTEGDDCGVYAHLAYDPRGINGITPANEWGLHQEQGTNGLYNWGIAYVLSPSSFAFKPGEVSTLSVEISGTPFTTECDLFFGFSIGGQQYVTFVTDVDGKVSLFDKSDRTGGAFIFPACTGGNDPVQVGDAKTLLSSQTSRLTRDVFRDTLADGDRNNYFQLSSIGRGNVSPLRFEFINDDQVGTFTVIFTSQGFSKPLQCVYDAVQTGTDFQIFVTPDVENTAEVYLIESLKITGTNTGLQKQGRP